MCVSLFDGEGRDGGEQQKESAAVVYNSCIWRACDSGMKLRSARRCSARECLISGWLLVPLVPCSDAVPWLSEELKKVEMGGRFLL